jgi:hypothetical protein
MAMMTTPHEADQRTDKALPTFQRNERGAWVPTDDPGSIAREMTAQSLLNWYPVKSWSYSEISSFGRDTDALLPSQRGESDRKRLVLVLNTDRRRFHTIRAEGAEPIGGAFTFEVHALIGGDDELGGYVRHWPRRDDGEDGDDLIGSINVRETMVLRLAEGLRSGGRVAIGLQMPVYKEAIAHSFDEGWMHQNLYVPYAENVIIDAFQVRVTEEYGVRTDDADTPPPLVRIDQAEPRLAAVHPELMKRMNWGLMLLAVIAVLLAVR